MRRFLLIMLIMALVASGCSSSSGGDSVTPLPTPTPTTTPADEIDDTSKAGIAAFLATEDYKSWSATKAQYTSSIHGEVATYFNSVLATSLTDGNSQHTLGSATVKEIYTDSTAGTLSGHAVAIKTSAGTGGDSWTWYELLSSGVDIYGEGHTSCIGCHESSSGAVDFIASQPD